MNNNPRKLFLPKLREMPEQCASCPFREDNDEEFGKIIQKLLLMKERREYRGKDLRVQTLIARTNIKHEVRDHGEFHCHCSAYDDDMNVKPVHEHRQCPGATKFYVEAGEKR